MRVKWDPGWNKFGIDKALGGKFAGKVDLHIHSSFSGDASRYATPAMICRTAGYYGFSAISITDHSSVSCIPRLLQEAKRHSVAVITGIELTCTANPIGRIDILGYGLDHEDPYLREMLLTTREDLLNRTCHLAQRINKTLRETAVTPDDLAKIEALSENGVCAGQEGVLAKLLHSRGYFPCSDADRPYTRALEFTELIGSEMPIRLAPAEVSINILKSAGGLVFWAHPYRSSEKAGIGKDGSIKQAIQQVLSNSAYEFDGIEAVHKNHSPEVAAYLFKLATDLGLLFSGGSDTHWNNLKNVLGLLPETALSFQPWMDELVRR
ncbi:MAG: PHP domain-containing protein [Candidatus Margulisiibacteriota bacterium]